MFDLMIILRWVAVCGPVLGLALLCRSHRFLLWSGGILLAVSGLVALWPQALHQVDLSDVDAILPLGIFTPVPVGAILFVAGIARYAQGPT